MKKYVKPTIQVIELRVEERMAAACPNAGNAGGAPISQNCRNGS